MNTRFARAHFPSDKLYYKYNTNIVFLVLLNTLINQKIALLEYNLHEIISSIIAIKEVDIYYISLYYLNDERFDIKRILVLQFK